MIREMNRSLTSFRRAVSVMWPGWHADWPVLQRLWELRQEETFDNTRFSSILAIRHTLETGRYLFKSLWSRHIFLSIGVTNANLRHCGKMPDAREELNRSVREWRIESRHSMKSLEGMGSSSYDLWAELGMHSFTVNCDTVSNEEKFIAVVPVTSVEVTCSEAMIALSFSTLMEGCLMKILRRSALG